MRISDWSSDVCSSDLHPRAWGNGYATEAGTAAIDWAFEHLGWDDIIHCIDPGNAASQRVAQRLGSRRLRSGVLPPPFENLQLAIWGQTRSQWDARRPGRYDDRECFQLHHKAQQG